MVNGRQSTLEQPTATFHCDRCNSEIAQKNLLKRSWSGVTGPACPNCGASLAAQSNRAVTVSSDAPALIRCAACGELQERMMVDVRTGAAQQVRYCANCGNPIG